MIAHRPQDVASFAQQVDRGVPLPRHVVDDVRIAACEVHPRHPGPALLVREIVEARSRERAAVQHHEDRPEVHVRLGEPVVLQLRKVPLDQLPLRRALDEEREVEAQPVPDRDEIPGRLEDALVEGHLDHLLLPPLPFRDHLERTDRGEVVVEGLVLDRHDPILLGIVPGRLDVEVVERQTEPVPRESSPAAGLRPLATRCVRQSFVRSRISRERTRRRKDMRVGIIGIGMTAFRPSTPEYNWKELMFEAASRAYADADVDPRTDVDSFLTCAEDYYEGLGIFDEFVPDQLGAALRRMCTVPGDGLQGLANAFMQIQTGLVEVAVVEAHSKVSDVLTLEASWSTASIRSGTSH